MNDAFNTTTFLIEGAGGIFDIVVDDSLVYSKHATGEFPDEQTLLSALRSQAG